LPLQLHHKIEKKKKRNPDWNPRARSQASKAKGGDIQQKDARVLIYFFNYVKYFLKILA
jgi:hypothetical protein